MAPVRVDQHDLQGNILAGYNFEHALFVVLRVTDPEAGRDWLGRTMDDHMVTTAVPFGESKPETTLNLAFTHDGLRALDVSEEALRSFPDDYRQGMAARADRLGDEGADAPARWETGLRPGDPHVLVTMASDDEDALRGPRDEIEARAGAEHSGVHIVHELATAVIADPVRPVTVREHFGFVDGLAQPSIDAVAAHDPKLPVGPAKRDGQGTPTGRGGWDPLAPGEFVLGYADEAGILADRPAEPLRRSGSYMVVRKLRQNVALFNNYMLHAADGDDDEAKRLAAKIVGRWHDGAPIVKSPEPPDPDAPIDNDFRYEDDPHGMRCPIGAHVRRANPRDALGFGGQLSARHRMIRRGMPYGPPIADPLAEDGIERGLMFVCYQASIERQFEVVQGRWLADGDAFGLGEDRDFLLGGEDPNGKMIIHGKPPRFLAPRRAFVINRGGGYFFAPGIAALRAIAEGV